MWLVAQKAILTKDNMIKRNWQGHPFCYFCSDSESVNHLMFSCPVSKVVWGMVALCFAQAMRPGTYEQYWSWIDQALPGGETFHMLGLAAICWAIWKLEIGLALIKKKNQTSLWDFGTGLHFYEILGRSISWGNAICDFGRRGDNDEGGNGVDEESEGNTKVD